MTLGPHRRLAIALALPASLALACSPEPEHTEATLSSEAMPSDSLVAAPSGDTAVVVAAEPRSEGRESREREHSEEHGKDGEEESGRRIARTATWDATRRGARLVLRFDSASNSFVGTVENKTASTLCAVRVEVHLTGGPELGPTRRADVRPGESVAIALPANGASFSTWTAHPETSACPR